MEAEHLFIKSPCCDRILHPQTDPVDLCGNAVWAQMLTLVFGMLGARHVLGVFDELLLRAHHGEQQVPCTSTFHWSGREAARQVSAIERFEVCGFEAEVHKPDRLRCLRGIDLNKLLVIYLEERFCGDSIFSERERLLKPKLLVEVTGAGEIRDPEGDMCDPGEGGRGWYLPHPQCGKQKERYDRQAGTEESHSVLLSTLRVKLRLVKKMPPAPEIVAGIATEGAPPAPPSEPVLQAPSSMRNRSDSDGCRQRSAPHRSFLHLQRPAPRDNRPR